MKFFYFKDNRGEYITEKSFEAARSHQKYKNFQGPVPFLYVDKGYRFVLMILKRGLANDEYISEDYYLFAWKPLPNDYGRDEKWIHAVHTKRFKAGPEPDVNVYLTSRSGVSFVTLVNNFSVAIENILKAKGYQKVEELYEELMKPKFPTDKYLVINISHQ